MKKYIGIDANEANVTNRVGTGEYTFNILTRFDKLQGERDFHIYLRDKPVSDMPSGGKNWHYHVIGPRKAWTRLALPLHLYLGHTNDVFWNPAHYLPPLTFARSCVTIHDLAYEFFPELFMPEDLYKLKNWTRSSVEHADMVIAVSEATKRDLIRLYNVPARKIKVIYNGYDTDLYNLKTPGDVQALSALGLEKGKYLLFVGTLQPRKNIVRLVQAFRLLKQDGYKGKLVIAGKIGWMAEETLSVIKESPDAADILLTGYISEKTKLSLYRHADVYVLPSLYEGFGVPVLEAMASGCPVAAADNSSLPEVVGDAGVLFEASDPADIARAVKEIKKDRTGWIKKGLEHARHFSWDTCAAATLSVLTKLAAKS